jgi:aryl-alcohol dehydrogenase-like predicted oxidoreductase
VALRYVLSQAEVSSAVLGPRRATQLDQLIRDAGKGPPYLKPDTITGLERRVQNAGLKP